jgi:hypothetical protein
MLRIFYAITASLFLLTSYAWNFQGHQVIAQIAYDHLTPQAKNIAAKYLNPRSKKTPNASFISAAIWLDLIKFRNIHWYDSFHYINIPFSTDGTTIPSIESRNIVWGINNAVSILSNPKIKRADKRLALFILIHLVGDIHQPLHAATKVSTRWPKGDLGGNLFRLGSNEVGTNLHKYWDNGAGLYIGRSLIKNKASLLEKKRSCIQFDNQNNPEQWAKESHELAVNQAYHIHFKEKPTKHYQLNAQRIVKRQTLMAGCRLAFLLNTLLS